MLFEQASSLELALATKCHRWIKTLVPQSLAIRASAITTRPPIHRYKCQVSKLVNCWEIINTYLNWHFVHVSL